MEKVNSNAKIGGHKMNRKPVVIAEDGHHANSPPVCKVKIGVLCLQEIILPAQEVYYAKTQRANAIAFNFIARALATQNRKGLCLKMTKDTEVPRRYCPLLLSFGLRVLRTDL